MKYIWPEYSACVKKYASVISDDNLVYVKGVGWCVILVPKGQSFDWEKEAFYEHEPTDGQGG